MSYTIGLDFGTLSVRAVVLNLSNGKIIASNTYNYPHGVITDSLPESDVKLANSWCLQHPDDYLNGTVETIQKVVKEANHLGISKAQIKGIGIDFTCCTVLPVTKEGTPLMKETEWSLHPHAWVKLWKHHAAQAEADQINQLATQLNEEWLDYYGGKVSSEWFFPKLLQVLKEDPPVYEAMAKFIEAGDWLVWQLTGNEVRNASSAGYKAMFQRELGGFPSKDFFRQLHPDFENVVAEKIAVDFYPPGESAGCLTKEMAQKLNLSENTIVAVNNIDAHVCVAATGVSEPNIMLNIIGTSSCDIVLANDGKLIHGTAGLVKDGAVSGSYAYETGQNAVGDLLAWFVKEAVPEKYFQEADKKNISIYQLLEHKAAQLIPGSSGLLALDWWNGNRSTLMDANLTGLIMGMTLQTKPEEIFRALIEATAFGKKAIIDNFETQGLKINRLVFCGGLPHKNKLLNQIYADIIQKDIAVSSDLETAAKSSAMFASVAIGEAKGGFDTIQQATQKLVAPASEHYQPNLTTASIYNQLYALYLELLQQNSLMNSPMKQLLNLKNGKRNE